MSVGEVVIDLEPAAQLLNGTMDPRSQVRLANLTRTFFATTEQKASEDWLTKWPI